MTERDDAARNIQFAANIGFLYTELPFLERIRAAARDGFDAVECHWPFELPSSRIADVLQEASLPMLGLNTGPGDLLKGQFGLSALPDRIDEARHAIQKAANYCSELGAKNLHVMAGNMNRSEASEQTFRDNLRYACDIAKDNDITILIEPLNRKDHPEYYLVSTTHAAEIISALNRPNLKMMFDVHHVRHGGEDVIIRFQEVRDLVGHIQIAGSPDRGEPGQSEINFLRFVKHSLNHHHHLWVGAEYRPKMGRVEAGIGWLSGMKFALTSEH